MKKKKKKNYYGITLWFLRNLPFRKSIYKGNSVFSHCYFLVIFIFWFWLLLFCNRQIIQCIRNYPFHLRSALLEMFLKEVRPGNLVFLGHICPVGCVGVSEDWREDWRRPFPPHGLATCRPWWPWGPASDKGTAGPGFAGGFESRAGQITSVLQEPTRQPDSCCLIDETSWTVTGRGGCD